MAKAYSAIYYELNYINYQINILILFQTHVKSSSVRKSQSS